MYRNLELYIDRATWPASGPPSFPANFIPGNSKYALHIPSLLLTIGYLTTPTAATGVSLSEFWAWVRYLAAVTSDPDLRLTSSFSDLDAHQKTILSDDFGMGAPMVWLTGCLALEDVCDGRYFMERIAAGLGVTATRSSKRGPSKTPDFVARDGSGIWHVLECKGTQSGLRYVQGQMGSAGPPPKNGVAQKRSIVFPSTHTGQRLVSGLSIAIEGAANPSRLSIIDPDPKAPFKVEESALKLAEDAVSRAVVARALRLAGFEAAADTTASPLGRHPSDRRSKSRAVEAARSQAVEERDARARAELARTEERISFPDGSRFRGRVLEFDLPSPISIDGKLVTRATVRQGVNRDVLAMLAERPTVEEMLVESGVDWIHTRGRMTVTGEGPQAELRIGELFMSQFLLS